MKQYRVGIVGACGYVGRELVRWVFHHPSLTLCRLFSHSKEGLAYSTAAPEFNGFVNLQLDALPPKFSELDILFLATPHGTSVGLIERTSAVPVVIDLSRDHRHHSGWAYGQPEWLGERLIGAKRIAAPGCFATALSLGIAPLVSSNTLIGPVRVSAATGSTGSGATAKSTTHHPERFSNIRAYKVFQHQHVPEIISFLGLIGKAPKIHFIPMSAPIDRGIFATIFVDVCSGFDVRAHFEDAYSESALVRIREASPELRMLRGTAFADISVHQDGETAAILVAIDNLGKGAAAQAIQALNISLGLPEAEGLLVPTYSP
ncbi:MAG: N-acetyl-gamma-glutamyl-phosphate reductase [Myxococcota bacterium]|nr:N-acetyl-gamma-glutamyl-phosphate reductase [Myxococcota bacterium]